ncbi:MAG: hypothetical protein NXI16_01125 [Alphaproteobacteria bacterium]|nr:hypothetical protein [Alphaproteobacteria bacterium]
MTRIVAISVLTHSNDLGGGLWNPVIRWTRKYAVFIEMIAECGTTGVGECWCFDASPDALAAYLATEIVPSFLGRELDEVEDIAAGLVRRVTLTSRHGIAASALSGIDIAARDLAARRASLPLYRYLSPTGSGSVRLYGSGGLYGDGKTTADLVDEMTTMADAGHSIVKLKIGAQSVVEDLARVRAVLNALPADVSIIIDAVYSYAPATALRVFEALPAERIEAFQSPVQPQDVEGMAWLVRQGVPVMGVEAEHRPELHRAMIDSAAVTFLQTAPIACGGIGRVRDLSAAVMGTDVRLSLEVSSTAVALAAACHLAAADECIAHVEYHSVHTVFFDDYRLERADGTGRCRLPTGEGLGLCLPHGALAVASVHQHSGITNDPAKGQTENLARRAE